MPVRFAAAALLLAAAAPSAMVDWPLVNQKLKKKQVSIHAVVLLPPLVDYKKVGYKGNHGGAEAGDEIAARLYASVARELVLRGVEIAPNPLDAAKTDADRFAVADLQARYDTVAVPMRRKLSLVDTGGVTLDDRVAKFAPGAASDALIFVRTFATSYGLTMPLRIGGFVTEISLVDSKTGEVLAFLRVSGLKNAKSGPADWLDRQIREAFRDIPLPVTPRKS